MFKSKDAKIRRKRSSRQLQVQRMDSTSSKTGFEVCASDDELDALENEDFYELNHAALEKNSSATVFMSPPPTFSPAISPPVVDTTTVDLSSSSISTLEDITRASRNDCSSSRNSTPNIDSLSCCETESRGSSGSESDVDDKGDKDTDTSDVNAPEEVGNRIKNLRILIIEDSNFQRKLMTRLLMNIMQVDMSSHAERWPVVSAGNGEEALALIDESSLKGSHYDVFIVDENLEGSGGILRGHEIVAHIRKQRHDLKDAIIIGCTANIHAYGQILLDSGANAVWAKPVPDPATVRNCIEELLLEQSNQPEKSISSAVSAAASST